MAFIFLGAIRMINLIKEFNMTKIYPQHGEIKYNAGILHANLYVMLAYDKQYESFCKFILSLKEKSVRIQISTILFQVSQILIFGKQDKNYYQLPEIFSTEPWRGQKLIIDIFTDLLNTKKQIENCVDYWERAEEQYL